jgi:hypothetical protein
LPEEWQAPERWRQRQERRDAWSLSSRSLSALGERQNVASDDKGNCVIVEHPEPTHVVTDGLGNALVIGESA